MIQAFNIGYFIGLNLAFGKIYMNSIKRKEMEEAADLLNKAKILAVVPIIPLLGLLAFS